MFRASSQQAEAMAAKSGTFAALLARAGLTGPLTILEGNGGYKEVVAGALDENVLRKRPDEFLLLTSCVKLWPCVFVAQAPIAAALNLRRQRKVSPGEIKNIVIYLSAFSYEQQKKFLAAGLSSRESADHSAPYCVARALLDGEVRLEHFDEKSFSEPRAVALFEKVSLARADTLPDKASVRLEVQLYDGGTLYEEVLYPPGHTENPVGEIEIVEKFRALSENVLGAENTKKISDIVLHMETAPNAAALLDRTVRDSREGPKPGSGAVFGKLSELLFVDAIRAYLETQSAQNGWTAGLKDRTVSRALALIHRNPDAEWTLESLARAVGVSRTALADHFTRSTGAAPMQYLSQWRLRLAAAGPLRRRREGKSVLYRIVDPRLELLCDTVCASIRERTESGSAA